MTCIGGSRPASLFDLKGNYYLNTKPLFLTSELIPEAEVNLVNLSLILESVSFSHEIQDNDRIYVTEDGIFPLWIKMNRPGFQGGRLV